MTVSGATGDAPRSYSLPKSAIACPSLTAYSCKPTHPPQTEKAKWRSRIDLFRSSSEEKEPGPEFAGERTVFGLERISQRQSGVIRAKVARRGWADKRVLIVLVIIPASLEGHVLVNQEIHGGQGSLIGGCQRPERQ